MLSRCASRMSSERMAPAIVLVTIEMIGCGRLGALRSTCITHRICAEVVVRGRTTTCLGLGLGLGFRVRVRVRIGLGLGLAAARPP